MVFPIENKGIIKYTTQYIYHKKRLRRPFQPAGADNSFFQNRAEHAADDLATNLRADAARG
jgi:hypothetical protein